MKLTKRIVSGILLLTVAATMFVGCGKEKSKTTYVDDPNEQVTIKWLYPGAIKTGSDEVFAEFNKKLAELLPNTTVEFMPIDWGSYSEKWKLMCASREEVDLVWTGYLSTYADEVSNGAYLPLNDLLDEYATDLKAQLPEWVWQKASINGKIYSMPNYQMMDVLRAGWWLPRDLKEKYIDAEYEQKIIDTNYSHKTATEEDFEVIEKYLEACKNGGDLRKGVHPISLAVLGIRKGYDFLISETLPYSVMKDDDDLKVVNAYETDSAKAYFKKMRDWYENGYIASDIASATYAIDPSVAESGILYMHGYYETANSETPSAGKIPTYWIPADDHHYISAMQSNTSTAISSTSAHPARAIKVLELVNTEKGKDLLNIIAYGLEGVNYTLVDGRVDKKINKTNTEQSYSNSNWVMGNTFVAYEEATRVEGYNDYILHEVNEKARLSKLMGWTPDTSPIATEISSVSAVQDEFLKQLEQGVLPNWQEKYDEMIAKINASGSENIIKELQAQIDARK